MKRIIDRAHQIASHALLRPRLDIPNRYSVSSNENSFFLRLLGSVPWNKSPGQSSVFIFDISYMNYNLFPFLSQKIFSTKTIEEKKKKERKKRKKSFGNNASSYSYPFRDIVQLITTNVIAICTRGRGKSRGPWTSTIHRLFLPTQMAWTCRK